MKKPTLLLFISSLLLAGSVSAQEAPALTQASTPASSVPAASAASGSGAQGNARGTARGPNASKPPAPLPPPLKENIKLTVNAVLRDGNPVAFSLTGVGPVFQTTAFLPQPNENTLDIETTIVHLQTTVSEVVEGYKVEFSLMYLNPLPVEGNGKTADGKPMPPFQTESTKSTVVLKLDTPTEVAAANGKNVTLKISKVAAK